MPVGIALRSMMAAGDLAAYGIKNAALFDGTSGYLSRTPTVAGSAAQFTFSAWILPSGDTNLETYIFSAGTGNSGYTDFIRFLVNELQSAKAGSAAIDGYLKTSQLFRDYAGFFHLVFTLDTAASATNKMRMYINGTEVTAFALDTNPTLAIQFFNQAILQTVGTSSYNTTIQFFNGYMAETYVIDGQALTPSSFGKTDPLTGNWIAKKYTGTYGTNGFHLDFSNATALGTDSSGKGNNWTVTGGVTQVTDTPTDVAATLNPLDGAAAYHSLALGNLQVNTSSTTLVEEARSTIRMTSGKWYYEVTITSIGNGGWVGLSTDNGIWRTSANAVASGYFYQSSGNKYINNTGTTYGAAWTTGDVIGVAVDMDGLTVVFYKNNVSQGVISIAALSYFATSALYGSVSTTSTAFTSWTYTPPTGFKALTTNNLPVVTATKKNVNNYFKTVLYTGTGATLNVTGVGFKPDFVWAKSRSAALNHVITDTCRGVTKGLDTAVTTAEQVVAQGLTAFDTDGFTLGTDATLNTSAATYVAWCANLPNTKTTGWLGSPTITPSKEIYNKDLGMSIVTYTGNGVAGATIPHSLGTKPGVVIIKRRDTLGQWVTYHSSLGATKALKLDDTSAASVSTTHWNDTEPTTQLISLGTNPDLNTAAGTYVAYIFAESDFIKIGSYTGNGLADGPFINEGVSPVWTLFKKDAVEHWTQFDSVRDPINMMTKYLYPNDPAAEAVYAGISIDFTSTGVKCRGSYSNINTSGSTYVYLMIGQPTGGSNVAEVTAR